MRQILIEMMFLSEQRGRHYEGSTIHGGDRDYTPHLDDEPLVDYWLRQYEKAKWACVREAEKGLKAARRIHIPEGQPPMPDQPMWKEWVSTSSLSDAEIGRLFNMSPQHINKVRKDYRG